MTYAALAEAYARRVQWEAKVQAVEMVRAMGEAMGEPGAETPRAPAGGQGKRVSADTLLRQMGTGV